MRVEEIMKKNTEKPQWGVVIMDKNEPDKLWTTTNGSPILVGFN
jgi:glucosamine 6-phosphate synthetase-like amidotransferase/phosphosugar isomerase protein